MNNIELTVERINRLAPLDVIKDEAVKQRFITIYDTLWGEGEAAYIRESMYFNGLMVDKPELQKATRFSIFTAFIDLAVCGLSLMPGTKAQCYLQGKNFCAGKDPSGKNIYEGRLSLTISGYGELVMRARCGQIKYADNPVLVYDEDEFSFSEKDGRKSVSYTCHLPHVSNHIMAAFMRIVRNDGSSDYSVMFEEDWLRLAGYSSRQNRKWDEARRCFVDGAPNALYTTRGGAIDQGFLCAKLIKHAFKTYPRVRIGKGTVLQSDVVDTQPEQEADYYGVQEQAASEPAQPEPFGGEPERSGGVQIDPMSNDDAF